MVYDFSSREREMGKVVLALTLNRKKMTERVVIARYDDARLRLEHNSGDVYYDETRPLGSLLIHFEGDAKREWNTHGMALRESYGKVFPFEAERWEMAAPVSKYLRRKYKSDEPSVMFAAIRTWEDYLNCYHMNHGADILTDRLNLLYRPFFLYADHRPWQEESAVALSRTIHDGESQVELWYPMKKWLFEVIVAVSSLLPVISYYLYKLEEWGFVFQECKVCGKYFAAKSRHFELCSDACRRVQAVEAKREFDERARARGDRLEQLDETAYNYWYTRLRKLRKGKNADSEKAAAIKSAFDAFRKEAVARKGAVKRGEMKLSEFSAWLALKNDEVDRLMVMGTAKLTGSEELSEAKRALLSLRNKSEKASGKLKTDTWQYRLTAGIVKASDVALSLIDGNAAAPFGRDTLDESFASLQDALRRAEAVIDKFAMGTSQHTLQKNRIAALKIALALIKEKRNNAK